MRNLRETNLGVTHGGRVVAVHRAEVALTVHQHVAQGEILSHANDGVVHSGIAVGVVLTNDIAHDTSRLFIRPIPVVVEFVHGEENTPVNRL